MEFGNFPVIVHQIKSLQTPERAALARQPEESTASRGPGLQLQTAATHSVPQPSAASPDNSIPQPTAEGPTAAAAATEATATAVALPKSPPVTDGRLVVFVGTVVLVLIGQQAQ